jgi:hypothetical protein
MRFTTSGPRCPVEAGKHLAEFGQLLPGQLQRLGSRDVADLANLGQAGEVLLRDADGVVVRVVTQEGHDFDARLELVQSALDVGCHHAEQADHEQ